MNAHAFRGEVTQKSSNLLSLIMLQEGNTALDGVVMSKIASTELAWKERTHAKDDY
jgi:hypothetical protein